MFTKCYVLKQMTYKSKQKQNSVKKAVICKVFFSNQRGHRAYAVKLVVYSSQAKSNINYALPINIKSLITKQNIFNDL